MNETRQTSSQVQAAQIDISGLLTRALYALRHIGWVLLLLMVIGGGAMYLHTSYTYVETYTAEATLTVTASEETASAASDDFANVATAEQMGKVFPYIMSSGILTDKICEDLGVAALPGSISVEVVDNTNLITIKATAQDGQTAYNLLQSVIKNYPEVALYVIGQTEIEVLNDTGVPGATGSAYVIRGSVRKGILLGLAVGILIVLLYAALHRTILYPSDVNSLLHVQCLGVLPVYKRKRRKKNKNAPATILGKNVPQDYLEALRTVRTRVERRMEKQGSKSLMVTSSVPGEGKSTVATNLAISFAQKGRRVIIVDCDLRNPTVQKNFGIKGAYPGLAAVLRGEADLEDALVRVPDDSISLEVLCGAVNTTQSISILGGEEMKNLIAELEQRADLVILDISPSAVLADAIVMARNVPSALYVVKYDYASTRHVVTGVEELSETGIDILGCVLNQGQFATNSGSYGYRYGSYGYKYGSYGKSGYGKSKKSKA